MLAYHASRNECGQPPPRPDGPVTHSTRQRRLRRLTHYRTKRQHLGHTRRRRATDQLLSASNIGRNFCRGRAQRGAPRRRDPRGISQQSVVRDRHSWLKVFGDSSVGFPQRGRSGCAVRGGFWPRDSAHRRTHGIRVCPEGVKAMRVSHTVLEKRFGVTATARNWNTLKKTVANL